MARSDMRDLGQDSYESSEDEQEDDSGLGTFESPLVDFEEDTFSLTVCTFIRDSQVKATGATATGIFISRLLLTFGLYILTITLQVFLLIQVKHWVSAKAVHDIRITYDKFELHMYGSEAAKDGKYTTPMTYEAAPEAKTAAEPVPGKVLANPNCFTETSHGYYRGKPGDCFHIDNFETMEDSDKSAACRISLSQPYFIFVILLLWAITCFSELKKCKRCFLCLIVNCKNIRSMDTAFEGKHKAEDDEVVIQGLTGVIKATVVFFCFIPRLVVTTYLLWVGSRWLLATDTFADLILNAVALEFILLVKEMIFVAMAPQRYLTELEKTKMVPQYAIVDASMFQLLEVFFWLGLSCGWVLTYMIYIQDVVPSYNWDVHDTCVKYLAKRYAV